MKKDQNQIKLRKNPRLDVDSGQDKDLTRNKTETKTNT